MTIRTLSRQHGQQQEAYTVLYSGENWSEQRVHMVRLTSALPKKSFSGGHTAEQKHT
jgi:hypothetical protein